MTRQAWLRDAPVVVGFFFLPRLLRLHHKSFGFRSYTFVGMSACVCVCVCNAFLVGSRVIRVATSAARSAELHFMTVYAAFFVCFFPPWFCLVSMTFEALRGPRQNRVVDFAAGRRTACVCAYVYVNQSCLGGRTLVGVRRSGRSICSFASAALFYVRIVDPAAFCQRTRSSRCRFAANVRFVMRSSNIVSTCFHFTIMSFSFLFCFLLDMFRTPFVYSVPKLSRRSAFDRTRVRFPEHVCLRKHSNATCFSFSLFATPRVLGTPA